MYAGVPTVDADLRQRRTVGRSARGDRLADAEVRDERVAFVQQDVLRLDVAVDDAVAVGVVERVGHLDGDRAPRVDRKLALGVEPVAQRLPLHHRHDEVQDRRRLAGVVQREDVRMVQPRGEADLAEEALAAERLGELGAQHLDGDRRDRAGGRARDTPSPCRRRRARARCGSGRQSDVEARSRVDQVPPVISDSWICIDRIRASLFRVKKWERTLRANMALVRLGRYRPGRSNGTVSTITPRRNLSALRSRWVTLPAPLTWRRRRFASGPRPCTPLLRSHATMIRRRHLTVRA